MKQASVNGKLAWAVSLVVLGAIGTGVALLDPPGTQRQRKLDERRVDDLMNLSQQIESYARRHDYALPPSLATLAAEHGSSQVLADPDTKLPYGYEVKDQRTYNLCADFALPTRPDARMPRFGRDWAHGKGRKCFELKAPKPK